MYFLHKSTELQIPRYFERGNPNNCLLSLHFDYGEHANGYTKEFQFTFLHPKGFYFPHVNKHNGHARFNIGLGLFTVSFDWFDKNSVVIPFVHNKA